MIMLAELFTNTENPKKEKMISLLIIFFILYISHFFVVVVEEWQKIGKYNIGPNACWVIYYNRKSEKNIKWLA